MKLPSITMRELPQPASVTSTRSDPEGIVYSIPPIHNPPAGYRQIAISNSYVQRQRSSRERSDYENLQTLISEQCLNYKLNLKRADIYIKLQQQARLYRELVVFLVFIGLYIALLVLLLPSDQSFEHGNTITQLLRVQQLGDDQSAFLAANTFSDIKEWIVQYLLPTYDNTDLRKFFTPIGNIQLRQVRSITQTCRDIIENTSVSCYSDFKSPGSQATGPFFGKLSGRAYNFSAGVLPDLFPSYSFLRNSAQYATYGNGGYLYELPRNTTLARQEVEALWDDSWVDEGTRVLVVNFAFWNRHTHLYTVCQMMTEFPTSGYIIATPKIRTVKLNNFDDPLIITLCIIFFFFVFFYGVVELYEMYKRGVLSYLMDTWNWIEVSSFVVFAVLIVYYFKFVTESKAVSKSISENGINKYVDLQSARQTQEIVVELAGLNVLLSCIRIFKFLRLNAKLTLLWSTLALAFVDLAAFVATFMILLAGYAYMGQLIFGYQVVSYHSFTSSFSTLFSFIGGNFNYEELNNASPVAGVVFFFSFMVLVFLILVNMFIAIIAKYYNEAHVDASKREREMKLENGLTPEENFSTYTKIRRFKLFVVLKDEPDAYNMPPQKELETAESSRQSRTILPQGTRIIIWLFKSSAPRDQTVQDPNYTPNGHRRAWSMDGEMDIPVRECMAKGKATYRRFLPEILSEGDKLYLQSSTKEDSCTLKLVKVVTDSRGQFLELDCIKEGWIHNWIQIQIPIFTGLRYAAVQYLAPTISRNFRSSRQFHLFSVRPPPRLYTMFEIEDMISRMVKGNEKKRLEETTPLRLQLEDILQEIRSLDKGDSPGDGGRKDAVKVDRARFEELLLRAVTIDQLLTKLRGSFTPRTASTGRLDAFLKLNEEAEGLEQLLKDQWNIKTKKEPPQENLRFDEVCRHLRLLLSIKHRTGYSAVDIKKAAVKMLAMFPLDCFDSLDKSKEHELYVPRPYDTSKIRDSDVDPVILLGDLVETLGEIIHDNWSMGKLRKGWRYGPTRNSDQKTTPCLIPYRNLPQNEKKYDLDMVCSTLRVIILLGYDIIRPPKGTPPTKLIPMPDQDLYKSGNQPRIPRDYVLKMIDTSCVSLNDDLLELRELLAENAHDVWAMKRKQEGWRYGKMNDNEKTSPLIIPYGLMLDDEKASDLSTITETITSVVALGYSIQISNSRKFFQGLLGMRPSL
eukprot:CAMPEP_0184653000 /NCGR_PEP_ID=MMETSP0308-20130426/10717_1 /TAXON_ID=38269 /ORGANISM="Gloeochaete witrockiana, Strain SAG 46.84" /LENGTH=1191 /DNA_ID=CAMNT_0027088225 /DNA_START=212 /DNA_END=3787 /DNA_ORIENTATION=+